MDVSKEIQEQVAEKKKQIWAIKAEINALLQSEVNRIYAGYSVGDKVLVEDDDKMQREAYIGSMYHDCTMTTAFVGASFKGVKADGSMSKHRLGHPVTRIICKI